MGTSAVHPPSGGHFHHPTILSYTSNDVKWSKARPDRVATAAANGTLTIWQLDRGLRVDRTITEHLRAINRLAFYPADGNLILTASQDGFVHLADLRTRQAQIRRFDCKAESVRDVQFHPTEPGFAAVFENGTLQKWDLRAPQTHERKWSAHNGLALSVEWYMDGRIVATGGRDRQIKIWDTRSENRKALLSVQTIAPIARVQWRPAGGGGAGGTGGVNGQGMQLHTACCALSMGHPIHVWDLNRTYVPHRLLDQHTNVTTGIAWQDADTLFSCSKDKTVVRHTVRSAHNPLSVLTQSAVAWNVYGDMAFALETPDARTAVYKASAAAAFDVSGIVVRQTCGMLTDATFDYEAVVYLVERYRLAGETPMAALESCRHNALMAARMSLHVTAHTWRLVAYLGPLLAALPGQKPPASTASSPAAPLVPLVVDGPRSRAGMPASASSSYDTAMSSPSPPASASSSASPAGALAAAGPPPVLPFDMWAQVAAMLEYYGEEGDVQMCVTVYSVLGFAHAPLAVPPDLVTRWAEAYVALLSQLRLFVHAAQLRRTLLPEEAALERTTYHVLCGHCGHGNVSAGAACEQCGAYAQCDACHRPLRGAMAWCSGCGHGGHLACLHAWIREENQCITGCGHHCRL
ncbi:hypothetical protein CXG81DRAFT_14112 [Caulochytrium protostelioides]|uniref:Uncharacterized protein n=1 Tax=Caulochytrium protostelioides TaxID=1555241 RepID=A0A4P9X3W6_9FUNG|nr:hypothetical protein CXG81DRAFT_14112 [Caulochytrium protostelioides]|eukprot:RKO99739.1 hypothetical protein CXG81DRAFT_14112 [Caulochytrium protostelioides]